MSSQTGSPGTESFRIEIFTIFVDLVEAMASASVIGRSRADGVIDIRVHDLRMAAADRHRSVDDAPYGGGAGMVMMPQPLFDAVERIRPRRPLFYLSPAGRRFDQAMAVELASGAGFSMLCGRYEGVDERVCEHLVDGEISVGDAVLAGGEAAALVVMEAVARCVPGVLSNAASAAEESFSDGLLEYPHYTRPAKFRDWQVPEVLLSGNHEKIARWRRAQSLARTVARRPDLIAARGGLSDTELELLAEHGFDVVGDAVSRQKP
ncbi:MAG: tRNA (guanosine(37)-N1)-methyltransferase TrmD [Acidimicrobiaceae bacterium]|nr:tRNA (guanosine(37)-N1)-methyltransferase TrmD [Acidimicrobiaceae bacterium]MCY4281185.1 tRNA (guanosine(37)-N1)-methyltransferase TrmD [Acidimicrobiaceae bacterium]MCY4294244.1 tRNA (guanosine(37)-N1)-methyltransferase TrmD [Acidimicrobiaceae bacterium]